MIRGRITLGAALLALATAGFCVDEPWVLAPSALVMEASTGHVLWSRAPEAHMFPASTTKILTAMLLLQHTKPDDVITAPAGIDTVGEASLHLKPGEKLKARDLALGIMLRSANDACVMAAIHVSGSVEAFVELMNRTAKDLGCNNTHFANPNGLHDPQHYTCATDLATIARAAMKLPAFREIVAQKSAVIERDPPNLDRLLKNHNKELEDPTCFGIKTGWTKPAGKCFVGYVRREGMSVITVVLGSTDWRFDHTSLAGWACNNFEVRTIPRSRFEYRVGANVRAELGSDYKVVVPKGDDVEVQVEPGESSAKVTVDGAPYATVPLKSVGQWPMATLAPRSPASNLGLIAAAGLGVLGVAAVQSRRRR